MNWLFQWIFRGLEDLWIETKMVCAFLFCFLRQLSLVVFPVGKICKIAHHHPIWDGAVILLVTSSWVSCDGLGAHFMVGIL